MDQQKQNINLSFGVGVDTKTDPFQVQAGKLLSLQNAIFTKGGLLEKRNGFAQLTSLPTTDFKSVSTFSGNLTAIGDSIAAYSEPSKQWVGKGVFQPISLVTLPLIRSNSNQTQADSAISANGLVCTVFTDVQTTGTLYRYAIADSVTGQNIVAPTTITSSYGTVTYSPQVFYVGTWFLICFAANNSGTYHLQYIAVSSANPTVVIAATDISTQYTPSSTGSFNGCVLSGSLFIAWNGNDGGGAIRLTRIDATLVQHNTYVFTGIVATNIAACADITQTIPVIWVATWDSGGSTSYAMAALSSDLTLVLAPTQLLASGTITNITAAAGTAQLLSVFYENTNHYTYDNAIPTNYLSTITITQGGTVGSLSTLVRSVGLASSAFVYNSKIYFLAAYQSPYQPTYFLINGTGNVVGKVAYQNGGGYITTGLPHVSLTGNVAQVTYLYKDLIAAVNKTTNPPSGTQVNGIYSQTGINLVSFTIDGNATITSEIGNDLHLGAGFLWMYDGYLPYEHNFFLYPASVESAAQADPAVTGTVTNTSFVITAIVTTGIGVGMTVTGTDIPGSTVVVSVGANTVTMSKAATGTHTGTTTFTGNQSAQQYFYQATYEWTDNQGNAFRSAPSIPVTATTSSGNSSAVVNVPTLRLTYKTLNPVKIVIYRWSVAQPVYYQVTSISQPLLNDTTIDYVSYVDSSSDATILGNNIIYTNGGVVEDVNAPSSSIMTLFDTRLWLVDAEDQNLLWFSKQVIENTPVEMSDLFTYYVAPTTAAQGDTGVITAMAPMDDKLIIFKSSPLSSSNAIYYINGTGPDNTGANNQYSQPIFVTSTVGCANQNSIVFMPQGLMFQSDKGIWLLGRDLSTNYIGAAVEAFNQYTVLSALNIPETNQVRFTLSNGVTLMYDYYYEQWGTFVNIPGVSSTLYQNLHTYINKFGQVLQETPGLYLDAGNPTLLSLTTAWFNLAGLQGYQRAFFFYLLGQYYSPFKLLCSIAYDYNTGPLQGSLIQPTNYNPPYGGSSPYGQETPYGGNSAVFNWRVFLKKQRCQAFQITLQEYFDPTLGAAAGKGLTLSGLNLVYGRKQGFRPQSAAHSIGGGTGQ